MKRLFNRGASPVEQLAAAGLSSRRNCDIIFVSILQKPDRCRLPDEAALAAEGGNI